MKDGLYRVHFNTPLGMGSGVVYARDGKMWGGDAGLYYVGTFFVEGDNLTATVETNRHTTHPGITSVFGTDRVTINISGTVAGDAVSARGSSPQAPGLSFGAELTLISD